MSSIYKGNEKKYFKDFNYNDLFRDGIDYIINEKINFFYKKKHLKSDFIVKNSYYNFPFFSKINEPYFFYPLKEEKKFLEVIKTIEDDLNIKITFGIFIKSENRCLISHNHIGYNYKLDRNLYTMKYILDYNGKESRFFCNNEYVKISKEDKDKWYIFKTFRPHMYISNDRSKEKTSRYELCLNFYKKDFFEQNKSDFEKIIRGDFFLKTNFNKHVAFEIGIKLLPSFFIYKKNKKLIKI